MKNEKPPVVHAKLDFAHLDAQETLDLAKNCLSLSAKSPLAPELTNELADLKKSTESLGSTMAHEKELEDELASVKQTRISDTETVKHNAKHLGNKAAASSNGDPTLLATCGFDQAKVRGASTQGTVEIGQIARDDIKLSEGAEYGSLGLKYPRLPGTTSVEIQYKAVTASPTDPWLPEDHIATSALVWTIQGLGHREEVRIRIRAVGVIRGPWSEDVVGRAK